MDANIPDQELPLPPWLQRLANSNIHTIHIVYSCFIAYLLYLSLSQIPVYQIMLSYLSGLLLWTFIEYIMHRFVFHWPIKNIKYKKFQFYMHGYHHLRPTDYQRLVLPLLVTIPLLLILYPLFKFLFGIYSNAILAGFITGYLLYDTIHYVIHRYNSKTKLGRFLKYYHFHHHFKSNQRCFGVTSPLWDYVFKTNEAFKKTL